MRRLRLLRDERRSRVEVGHLTMQDRFARSSEAARLVDRGLNRRQSDLWI